MNIRKITAPIALAVMFICFSFIFNALPLTSNQLYIAVGAIVSVVIAYHIWPSSTFSVAVVLVVVSIVFPILVLYAVGNHDNLETPLSEIANYIEWTYFLMPFIAGVGASYTLKHLTSRSSRDRANRAAP